MVLDSDQPRCPAVSSTVSAYQYRRRKAGTRPLPPALSGRRRWPAPAPPPRPVPRAPPGWGGTQPAPERPERPCPPAVPAAGGGAGPGCAPPPPDSPGSAGAGRAGWRSTAGASSPPDTPPRPALPPGCGRRWSGTSPVLVLEPGQGLLTPLPEQLYQFLIRHGLTSFPLSLHLYRACPAPAGRAAREKNFSAYRKKRRPSGRKRSSDHGALCSQMA